MNSWIELSVKHRSVRVTTENPKLRCSREGCKEPRTRMNASYLRSECLEHYRETQRNIMRLKKELAAETKKLKEKL